MSIGTLKGRVLVFPISQGKITLRTSVQTTNELGFTSITEFKIDLIGNARTSRFLIDHRYSEHENSIIRNKVKDLLKTYYNNYGIKSFVSPGVLVKKRNGDYRLCVDYRIDTVHSYT